jgi:two-component system CheB/CheR fusion protein
MKIAPELQELQKRVELLESENKKLQLKQVEINQAKELYLKIFEEFPALIWRSRLDMLCDHFNKTWLDFTGRTMEQEFGNGWAEGVHPDDFQQCLDIYVSNFEKRQAFVMEYRMKNNKGEYRWIRDHGRPFYDLDNAFLGYIGSCYDITENKNNELRLVELNATKDKFFSLIGHDLKNPINSIIGLSNLLIKKNQQSQHTNITELAEGIYTSSQKVMNLLVQLLDWARINGGAMDFHPTTYNLQQLILDNIALFDETAKLKSLELVVETHEPIEVFVDIDMMNAVMRNLISNAIKYSFPDNAIRLSWKQENGHWIICIKDYGVGIPQADLDNLFKLEHGPSTLGTQKEKGTGLGLLLCKEFIQRHGSQIWVESQENKGTSFYFTLPITNLN